MAIGSQQGHRDALQGIVHRPESIRPDAHLCRAVVDAHIAGSLAGVGRLGRVRCALSLEAVAPRQSHCLAPDTPDLGLIPPPTSCPCSLVAIPAIPALASQARLVYTRVHQIVTGDPWPSLSQKAPYGGRPTFLQERRG